MFVWGMANVIVQTDQEAAGEAVARRAAEKRRAQTMIRTTPRRSKQSLGAVSRWHRTLQEQIRVTRLQVEENLGQTLNVNMKFVQHGWSDMRRG